MLGKRLANAYTIMVGFLLLLFNAFCVGGLGFIEIIMTRRKQIAQLALLSSSAIAKHASHASLCNDRTIAITDQCTCIRGTIMLIVAGIVSKEEAVVVVVVVVAWTHQISR